MGSRRNKKGVISLIDVKRIDIRCIVCQKKLCVLDGRLEGSIELKCNRCKNFIRISIDSVGYIVSDVFKRKVKKN